MVRLFIAYQSECLADAHSRPYRQPAPVPVARGEPTKWYPRIVDVISITLRTPRGVGRANWVLAWVPAPEEDPGKFAQRLAGSFEMRMQLRLMRLNA
jgi:hypothetical protein